MKVKHKMQINMAERNPKNILEALLLVKKVANKRYQGIIEKIEIKSDQTSFHASYGTFLDMIYFFSLPVSLGDRDNTNRIIDKAIEANPAILNELRFDFKRFSSIYDNGCLKVEPFSGYNLVDFDGRYRKFIKRNGHSNILKREAVKRGLETHTREETYGEREIQHRGIGRIVRMLMRKPATEKVSSSVKMLCIVPRTISELDKMRFIQREISENNPVRITLERNYSLGIEINQDDMRLFLSESLLTDKVMGFLDFVAKDRINSIIKDKWNITLYFNATIPDIKDEKNIIKKTKPTTTTRSEEEIISQELINKGYTSGKGDKGIADYCVLVK